MELQAKRLIAKELQLYASAHSDPVLFHGKSMLPFFEDGDELTVEPVAWEDIVPGDIITYRLDERFPTCRVASKQGDHLNLIADNWRGARFEVWRDDVLGRVSARRRGTHVLRRTDSAWRQYAQGILLRRLARAAAAKMRFKAARARHKLHDAWIVWRKGYTDLPRNIQVNVSARCNLRCRMCPYLGVHRDPHVERYMSHDTFARILPVIQHIGQVSFSGAGEPTFNKDLLHFIELTRKASPAIHIEMVTNGTNLTREFCEALIRLRVFKIHVSLDGLNPETVMSIRRGIPHARVLENIRMLGEIKKEMQSAFPVIMINYMMGHGTYREFADFIPLAHQLGVGEINILEIQPSTAEDYADNMMHNMQRDGGREFRQAIKRATAAGIRLQLHGVIENACYHPTTPHIGEDGAVYPCCFLEYEGRPLYHEGKQVQMVPISYGNINRTSFREIWNSPPYVELRTRVANGDFPGTCSACYKVRAESAHEIFRILGPR